MGRGSSPGHVLHPFLLALHTNLAADVAKLGVVSRAHGRGDTGAVTGCKKTLPAAPTVCRGCLITVEPQPNCIDPLHVPTLTSLPSWSCCSSLSLPYRERILFLHNQGIYPTQQVMRGRNKEHFDLELSLQSRNYIT